MKVTIYGSGYVGLVTGACLAQVGNDVLCVDVDPAKIDLLKSGGIPIYEPGLDQIVADNIAAGRLNFTLSAEEGVQHGLVQFIAVGTPPDEDGSADLTYVLQVARSIAENMNDYRVIVDKSTVPVGTADKVKSAVTEIISKRNINVNFDVVSNPEFLKEGNAIEDFMKPDRIVIGTDNDHAKEVMHELYLPFNRNHERIITMDIRSAELTKYAANALLATKISFMNELSNLSEILGADIENVRIGIGSDPRIGYHFIYPGCGYGGSCFPKDVQALERTAKEVGYNAELLSAVESVNYRQKDKPVEKINKHYDNNVDGKTFAVWGLAFKPNTDDMREASSRVIINTLREQGASIQAYDPVASEECSRIYADNMDGLTLCSSAKEALEGADALIIVTEWQEFRSPNFDEIKASLKDPVIVDGRNLYDPETMKDLGFSYYAIGRGM
ncbi:MAG: UDP-glucose dehydrogenase (EC [uncultured Thiotrichaceae bacterium]|uniref:UDP-glucose 6-dehydrogenase n=1 Tax=uncultured Thiotrichaceae bacterium TaxID=298394 RepID=A0A6S6S1Q3_9GAMM|nr:MAG: UDP-glucose dehydrogenase (EC [uncultured Thiotrichaceae bacterium]